MPYFNELCEKIGVHSYLEDLPVDFFRDVNDPDIVGLHVRNTFIWVKRVVFFLLYLPKPSNPSFFRAYAAYTLHKGVVYHGKGSEPVSEPWQSFLLEYLYKKKALEYPVKLEDIENL